jgi:1,4-dihydroxy-2-naphthoate octaprenyltransferase
MKYPITFYNAIWLILFGSLFIEWNWWTFSIIFLFAPTWKHLRDWYDQKKEHEQYISQLDADAGSREILEEEV